LESQFVVFSLGAKEERSEYGVPISQVQEVGRLVTPTRLPQVPEFVEGVINLRDRVIPIIDLRKRFGLTAEYTDTSRIMVVEVGEYRVGIIVDRVLEVISIPEGAIEPPPPMIGGLTAEYLTGVGKVNGDVLIILDMTSILSASEKKELMVVEQ
jgi:purine-binding chemotaxis protein CheW